MQIRCAFQKRLFLSYVCQVKWGRGVRGFWITGVTEQKARGKKFAPAYDDHEDLTITANWKTATRNGNTLTVTILPTTSDDNRLIKVSV